MKPETVEAIVIGAGGYVGGEVLRLLAHHPHLNVTAATSASNRDKPVSSVFPHLLGAGGDLRFIPPDGLTELIENKGPLAVFGCAPHGQSACLLDRLLSKAEQFGREIHVVDMSADFRHRDAKTYERIYGTSHGAPDRLADFTCALPDLTRDHKTTHVAHPGCFTTAVTLGAAPFLSLGLVSPEVFASAVTGSTGSGTTASAATHHPDRCGNLKAYKPLTHRHTPEMEFLIGSNARVTFVPHSGPFARGIHATLHLKLATQIDQDDLTARVAAFYEGSPFIAVSEQPPSLRHVVGTNRCHLGIAASGKDVVVLSVIDNLTKGAAGGAIQWMNRLFGFAETSGLDLPGLGWA